IVFFTFGISLGRGELSLTVQQRWAVWRELRSQLVCTMDQREHCQIQLVDVKQYFWKLSKNGQMSIMWVRSSDSQLLGARDRLTAADCKHKIELL
ncbi:hypothetical protein J0S82_001629, partial [Galemys pyrenaicus]